MRRPALRSLATVLLGVAFAAGCFGRSLRSEFFTLRAAAGTAAGAPVSARPELGLAIGPIEFPRYLDRPEIVTRDGAHRLLVSESRRWAGSLRSDVLRVVADDLGVLLGTPRIAVYPTEPRFRTDYRVLLDVRAFEGILGESVTLRMRWTIASGADGRALAIEESRVEQPVASATWEDFIAAHSAALGTLSRRIATRIGELSAP